jgi:hypothetical protein
MVNRRSTGALTLNARGRILEHGQGIGVVAVGGCSQRAQARRDSMPAVPFGDRRYNDWLSLPSRIPVQTSSVCLRMLFHS